MGKPKCSSLCPGCKTPKKDHSFSFPGKYCGGPSLTQESNVGQELSEHWTSLPCQVDATFQPSNGTQEQDPSQHLLEAMRNLSLELEGLAEEISIRNAPKPVHGLVIQVVLITCLPSAVPLNPITCLKNLLQLPLMVSAWIFLIFYLPQAFGIVNVM